MARLVVKIGIALSVAGLLLVMIFAFIGSDVDQRGVLREPFYLLGIGAPSLAVGLLFLLGSALSKFVTWARSNRLR